MQSFQFWEQFKSVPFDVVYTSSLLRARQSVSRFIASGIPHVALSALDEISWGVLEGVSGTRESDTIFLDLLRRWKSGEVMASAERGESPLEVQYRQQEFLQHIREIQHGNVLVCMHGRAMRILLCTLTGTPLSEMEQFPHTNLCLYQLHLHEGKAEVVRFNDTGHLNSHSIF